MMFIIVNRESRKEENCMKNKKGFTLVELIGVITLLALIALVVYPAITTVMKNTREKAYNDQIEVLIKAAKQWGVENADKLPDVEGGMYTLSISTLLSDGYLTNDEVVDPRNTETTLTGTIIIRNASNQYNYAYAEETFQTVIATWLTQNVTLKDGDTYSGANPNNYISFNNELWRIVKINSDGTVKIIRNEALPERAWDTSGTGVWDDSSIKNYLNEVYYNTIKQVMYLAEEEWCTGTLGDNICETKSTFKVGLITANEYVAASANSSCQLSATSTCGTSNYLNMTGTYYTLTRGSDSSYNQIYRVQNGTLLSGGADSSSEFLIKPVVNLNASVKITGGNGTAEEPYKISL